MLSACILHVTQAIKDDYQLTLMGHSLGAGAAALLAMMLQPQCIAAACLGLWVNVVILSLFRGTGYQG